MKKLYAKKKPSWLKWLSGGLQTYSFLEAYIDMLFFSCFQGAKEITFGAVIESITALAVAAGIFVFFLWKSRKRNNKNSNGKSSI